MHIQAILSRTALLALLWWVLTEGEGVWGFGAPVILAALAASLSLSPPGQTRLAVSQLPPFVASFFWHSLHGGADVARRALHRRLPIAPDWLEYRLRLPDGPGRVFLSNIITLMPGTLAVETRDDRLRLHVLDRRLPVTHEIAYWEMRVAYLLRLPLAEQKTHG